MAQRVAEHVWLLGLIGRQNEALEPVRGSLADRTANLETALLVGQHRHHHSLQPNAAMQALQQGIQDQAGVAAAVHHQPQVLQ